MLLVAVIGFTDAAYLTISHFLNRVPPCTIGGCETVLTSKFAAVGPIPLALIGAGYYIAVLGLLLWYQAGGAAETRKLLRAFITVGFLISLMLLGIQAFILRTYCLYCMFSLGASTLLMILSFFLWRPPGNSTQP